MTGLEMLRSPGVTESEIVDIISSHCPPGSPKRCEDLSCRGCWLLWLTGRAPEKRPPDERTAPDEEGLHPNLVEMYAKVSRTARTMLHTYAVCSPDTTQYPAPEQHDLPQPPVP